MRPDISGELHPLKRDRRPAANGTPNLKSSSSAQSLSRSEAARQARRPVELAEIRFNRAVADLCRLGPRALAEMLAEIGARHLLRTEIELTVRRYVERLNSEAIEAAGGDRFPASLWRVR